MEIKRIGILSTSKMFGALYFALGLLFGLIFACMGLVGLAAEAAVGLEDLSSGIFILVGACAFPIFYGLMGAVAGAILAGLYNVIAGVVGGLELEFAEANSG